MLNAVQLVYIIAIKTRINLAASQTWDPRLQWIKITSSDENNNQSINIYKTYSNYLYKVLSYFIYLISKSPNTKVMHNDIITQMAYMTHIKRGRKAFNHIVLAAILIFFTLCRNSWLGTSFSLGTGGSKCNLIIYKICTSRTFFSITGKEINNFIDIASFNSTI